MSNQFCIIVLIQLQFNATPQMSTPCFRKVMLKRLCLSKLQNYKTYRWKFIWAHNDHEDNTWVPPVVEIGFVRIYRLCSVSLKCDCVGIEWVVLTIQLPSNSLEYENKTVDWVLPWTDGVVALTDGHWMGLSSIWARIATGVCLGATSL